MKTEAVRNWQTGFSCFKVSRLLSVLVNRFNVELMLSKCKFDTEEPSKGGLHAQGNREIN